MLEFSKNYSLITYNRTFLCKKMPYPNRIPEHFHIEVLSDITLTVKYPIDIKVALQPEGTVKLPLGDNSCSFQNQSTIDSSCNFYDQSKQILILNKNSITSILLPIGTKVNFTQENNISYHFENTTSKQLSITDLNLFINTYEYLTGELSATLSLVARNKLILLEIEEHDKTYLKYYKNMDKDLIDLFAKQNDKIIVHEEIDLFKYYYLELWHSDANYNEYIGTSTSLLGTSEHPTE